MQSRIIPYYVVPYMQNGATSPTPHFPPKPLIWMELFPSQTRAWTTTFPAQVLNQDTCLVVFN